MRIEELILEGFKSYPVRTVITGWDPSFNAITGLNGSGKSNILDAICFVLGITNMSSMRAQSQQDLIYKRGQAGITKASVTVVFDNSDRANSPVGLENLPQITVTRQIAMPNISKYLLNGHKSQQQTIQSLFQSVQLNINNPNFLIMQGRITKVLNMKPQEILGMVEEASGTRMFEERKDKAKKTMGKKEKRVDEITSLLQEEIGPKLDSLRNEKKAFLKWQKANSELERVGRTLRAFEWTDYHDRIVLKDEELAANAIATKAAKKDQVRFGKESDAAEKAAEVVRKQQAEEMKGGKFAALEQAVTTLGKEAVKIQQQVENKKGDAKEEEKKVKDLENEQKELEASLGQKQTEVDELTATFNAVKEKHTATQAALTSAEDLLQTLLTGLAGSSKNTGGGYMGQLADARERLVHAETEEQQCRSKLEMSQKDLKAQEARYKEVEKEAGQGAKNLQAKQAEVEKMRHKLAGSGWSAEKEQEKESTLNAAKADVRRLTEERDVVKSRLSQLDFNYSHPGGDFDPRKVKGLVASLITLNPQHYNKSTALEIAAGGKLYNVVVENAETSKALLRNGKMKKRITFIPLNQIQPYPASPQKLQAAMAKAPGKVHSALSLVGHAPELAKAMAFVFSDTLICDDAETAEMLTFSPEIGLRSVTLNGDVYDPSGMLSGGAAPSSSGILVKAQQLQNLNRKLNEAQQRLQALLDEEQKGRQGREQWKGLVQQLEIKEHEVHLLQEQLGGSNATRIGAQVEELKKTIADVDGALKAAKERQKAAKDTIQKLERDMAEFKDNKEGKIDELKADISKQKVAIQKQSVAVKMHQKDLQTATLEKEQIEQDIERAGANIVDAQVTVEKLRKELNKSLDSLKTRQAEHTAAEKRLKEERATLTRFDDELADLDKVIKDKKQAVADAVAEITKLEHQAQGIAKEKAAYEHQIVNLEKQNEWIAEENHLFGKRGSQYDFDGINVQDLRAKAEELEQSNRGMKKKINPKVMNMIDSVEKREAGLKKMLATVLKDKEKIEQTIEQLDQYKRDALVKTWEKVNGSFGDIFAELLPGNFSKLQAPEGQDVMDGLEIKVRLGSVWKQSLTELSGGQRSLIALSLIMALLQFKPAPVYILDEIDAALDLSHTQNIGTLFRTRFKGAQFIVVSLKEGLFTNANVLFRTRFRDGTSIVERTAERSGSRMYNERSEEGGGSNAPRKRGARR